jgi:hypothetical protein
MSHCHRRQKGNKSTRTNDTKQGASQDSIPGLTDPQGDYSASKWMVGQAIPRVDQYYCGLYCYRSYHCCYCHSHYCFRTNTHARTRSLPRSHSDKVTLIELGKSCPIYRKALKFNMETIKHIHTIVGEVLIEDAGNFRVKNFQAMNSNVMYSLPKNISIRLETLISFVNDNKNKNPTTKCLFAQTWFVFLLRVSIDSPLF